MHSCLNSFISDIPDIHPLLIPYSTLHNVPFPTDPIPPQPVF